jgi:hypothetical protein
LGRVYILIPVFENIVDGNEFRGDRRTKAYSQLPFMTNTAKRENSPEPLTAKY